MAAKRFVITIGTVLRAMSKSLVWFHSSWNRLLHPTKSCRPQLPRHGNWQQRGSIDRPMLWQPYVINKILQDHRLRYWERRKGSFLFRTEPVRPSCKAKAKVPRYLRCIAQWICKLLHPAYQPQLSVSWFSVRERRVAVIQHGPAILPRWYVDPQAYHRSA